MSSQPASQPGKSQCMPGIPPPRRRAQQAGIMQAIYRRGRLDGMRKVRSTSRKLLYNFGTCDVCIRHGLETCKERSEEGTH
jgi:hypothetical protein